ncbi:MAG TPA: type I restriction endonuclease subunit R [Syntrophus sp. (in: bacteria)]|nr:type I restriction endonuclease subunit R [Syntrophus sp. (in: bacteria)]
MITDINSEDRLVQKTFADHLHDHLGWESVYAYNAETFGPEGTLGRKSAQETVLVRDLRAAMGRLNPELPESALDQAAEKLTRTDFARSLLQHNREFYGFIRGGVPVEWRDGSGETRHAHARVIDFGNGAGKDGRPNNRFLAVRELKLQGLRVPHYNTRADLVCFVNGLPLVFIELKAVYKNIRAGFDNNLTWYLDPNVVPHAFHHNAFLVVSNGDKACYGSITSKWEHFVEWKRNTEKDKGCVDAEALLDGMLSQERLLDLVENFILFDDSRAGGTRKIVARNHQVLGVNNAVASVKRQEELKILYPERLTERSVYRMIPERQPKARPATEEEMAFPLAAEVGHGHMNSPQEGGVMLPLIERAHPDLGRLGVFWHTQGSGKSYSMAFFAEKVRRAVPGNFTFLVMTDREDLDDQIWRTFIGCGVTDEQTPRAGSGKELQEMLHGDHRFVFSLIHKFNQPVTAPYSERDDIIVISDEAHRTQAGKFARNMRIALPNAAFIGFTGTPLFKHDELTRRIFGDYISRYDFKRSEEDHSTVRLIYENRGEKLGLARPDLNARIAEAVEKAELDPDQSALLEKLLGKDYEVITADERLDRLAADFVEHCSTRWQTGKSMFVCIDKITCARMFQRIEPLWKAKIARLKAIIPARETALAAAADPDARERLGKELESLRAQVQWMEGTIIEIIISEAQNEVKDFKKWNFDIIPHRAVMKTGFQTPDGKRVAMDDAFKDPQHPFRIALVCAMWLTGFDVECLATLYIDKPMKAHSLMQAIARANRVYPGKDCGVIVDYNGMLRSLREALAQYALGGEDDGNGGAIVAPIEELVAALLQAIEATESHLRALGFDPVRLQGATGFDRIEALRDAVDALYTSDEGKRRFEIMARQVFIRFKALLMEPSAFAYSERHDNIETIYKKLQEKRDTADVTELLKALHRIVNEAIRTAVPGDDQATGLKVDLSRIDFEKLRNEFAKKVRRKHAALQDIRDVVERKLAQMLARNPMRMDYYRTYQEIIADYNREKDRATVEETFARLMDLASRLDAEERRAAEEGLSDDELALFDLLFKDRISKGDRERLKQASKTLLASLEELLRPMPGWTQNTTTQAEVRVFILDNLWRSLPRPPFTDEETEKVAERVYDYVWQRSSRGPDFMAA